MPRIYFIGAVDGMGTFWKNVHVTREVVDSCVLIGSNCQRDMDLDDVRRSKDRHLTFFVEQDFNTKWQEVPAI